MALPTNLTAGVSTGHLSHHTTLAADRNADGGSLPTSYTEGQLGHDATVHPDLKTWYDAANPLSPLPTLPARSDPAYGTTHETVHEILHAWRNSLLVDTVLWNGDFDTGLIPPYSDSPVAGGTSDPSNQYFDVQMLYNTAGTMPTMSFVTDVTRHGTGRALKIVGPPGFNRAQWRADFPRFTATTNGDDNEYWVGFSFRLSAGYSLSDLTATDFHNIAGWRQFGDDGATIYLTIQNGDGTVVLRRSNGGGLYADGTRDPNIQANPQKVTTGEWVDVVMHTKLSTTTTNALREFWVNGVHSGVMTDSNVVTTTDDMWLRVGPYMKGTHTVERTVHYDNVKIGNSYSAVDPSVGPTSLPATPWSTHPGTFSTPTEETDYIAALDAASSRVQVVQMGTSVQGRPLRLVIVGPPRTEAEIRSATTMMVMGGIHGDEISGRDAILNHMRAHAASSDTETILYYPSTNPDGINSVTRNSTQGDLNRRWDEDPLPYTEQPPLKSVLVTYKPMVVLDTHEYTSTGTMFRFKPLGQFLPGTPAAVQTESDRIVTEYLKPAAEAAGYSTGYYGGSVLDNAPGTQTWATYGLLGTFTETPKSSSGGPTLRVAQSANAIDALLAYVRANVSSLASFRSSQTYT